MTEHWRDLIVGDRMAVDEQFSDRITNSGFSRQQWGLVMTAVEFDIEQPNDAEHAQLVADTSSLPAILPELDAVEQLGPMGGAGGPGNNRDSGGSSLVNGVKNMLGIGGGEEDADNRIDQQQLDEAQVLAQAYATALQDHLEETGKWEQVRAAATDQ